MYEIEPRYNNPRFNNINTISLSYYPKPFGRKDGIKVNKLLILLLGIVVLMLPRSLVKIPKFSVHTLKYTSSLDCRRRNPSRHQDDRFFT